MSELGELIGRARRAQTAGRPPLPEGAIALCHFCEKPIYTIRQAFRYVAGWERAHRDAGGTNALALREKLGDWACSECIRDRRGGKIPGQESLL